MIEFDQVTVTYADAPRRCSGTCASGSRRGSWPWWSAAPAWASRRCSGAVNGLVPHFTGGTLAGRVVVDGRDTRTHPPRELADVVGVVGQDPLSGFVTDTVEEELAYGMEQLAVAPDVMRKRVEETLDLLGIAELRGRASTSSPGGQQQRVATRRRCSPPTRGSLVLDEPTSALDPTAAEEVLAAVTRLVHDLGVTVVLAEHRLERVVQYADRVVEVHHDGIGHLGGPRPDAGHHRGGAPGGRARPLRRLVAAAPVGAGRPPAGRPAPGAHRPPPRYPGRPGRSPGGRGQSPCGPAGSWSATGSVTAVRQVDLDLAAGEVTALMGRNGSGKSSLLWALQGTGTRQSRHGGRRPAPIPGSLAPAGARRLVGLVPQTPTDLLYLDTVADECAQADARVGSRPGGVGPVAARRAGPRRPRPPPPP